MQIQNPHDRFFKRTFGEPETAVAFLRAYLPPELVEQIDLTSLVPIETTLVDEELAEHQHDLLYEAQKQGGHGRSLFIYLLFEHKSYPDKWVLLQLLRYMLKLWQEEVSNKGEVLRPILPILIYHGEAVWPFGTEFHTYFDELGALRPFVPNFSAFLKDFSARSEEEIRGERHLQAILLTLRRILDRNLAAELIPLMRQLFTLLDTHVEGELRLAKLIVYYFTEATDKVSYADMKQALTLQGASGENMMQTIALELKREGWREGEQAGLQIGLERGEQIGLERGEQIGELIGLREAVYQVLWARFGDVPDELWEQVEVLADAQLLRQAAVQAALAPALEQFAQWVASLNQA